jgi:beta-lactam-binding protein with PASTA domain
LPTQNKNSLVDLSLEEEIEMERELESNPLKNSKDEEKKDEKQKDEIIIYNPPVNSNIVQNLHVGDLISTSKPVNKNYVDSIDENSEKRKEKHKKKIEKKIDADVNIQDRKNSEEKVNINIEMNEGGKFKRKRDDDDSSSEISIGKKHLKDDFSFEDNSKKQRKVFFISFFFLIFGFGRHLHLKRMSG